MGIVVFHFSERLGFSPEHVEGLDLFVDVFFVVSGIVITHVYLTKVDPPRRIWRFLLARLARLGPLHWLLTFGYVAIGAASSVAHLPLTDPDKYVPSCLPAVFTFTHALGGCNRLVYNTVSWSISAEYAMYLLFPVIAFASLRFRVIPLILFVIVLAALFHFDPDWFLRTFDFGALRALPGFLLGVSLGLWRTELSRIPVGTGLFGPVLLLMLGTMLVSERQGLSVMVAHSTASGHPFHEHPAGRSMNIRPPS